MVQIGVCVRRPPRIRVAQTTRFSRQPAESGSIRTPATPSARKGGAVRITTRRNATRPVVGAEPQPQPQPVNEQGYAFVEVCATTGRAARSRRPTAMIAWWPCAAHCANAGEVPAARRPDVCTIEHRCANKPLPRVPRSQRATRAGGTGDERSDEANSPQRFCSAASGRALNRNVYASSILDCLSDRKSILVHIKQNDMDFNRPVSRIDIDFFAYY